MTRTFVNSVDQINNDKAKEFHSINLSKFKKAYYELLGKAESTTSDDKRDECRMKAEALRIKYNTQLAEYVNS